MRKRPFRMKGPCLFLLILVATECSSQVLPIFGFPQATGNRNPGTQNSFNLLNPISGVLNGGLLPTSQDGNTANGPPIVNPLSGISNAVAPSPGGAVSGTPYGASLPIANNNPLTTLFPPNGSGFPAPPNMPNSVAPMLLLDGANALGSIASQGANLPLNGTNGPNPFGSIASQGANLPLNITSGLNPLGSIASQISNNSLGTAASQHTNPLAPLSSPSGTIPLASPFAALTKSNPLGFMALFLLAPMISLAAMFSLLLKSPLLPLASMFLVATFPLMAGFSLLVFPLIATVPLISSLTAMSSPNATNPLDSTALRVADLNPPTTVSSPSASITLRSAQSNSVTISLSPSTGSPAGPINPFASVSPPNANNNPLGLITLLSAYPPTAPSTNSPANTTNRHGAAYPPAGMDPMANSSGLPFDNIFGAFWRPFRSALSSGTNGTVDPVRLAFAPIFGTWDGYFELMRSFGWPFASLKETLWRPYRSALEFAVNGTSQAFASSGASQLLRSLGWPFSGVAEAKLRPTVLANGTIFGPASTAKAQNEPVTNRPRQVASMIPALLA